MMNWFADFYNDIPWLHVFIMATVITQLVLIIRVMQYRGMLLDYMTKLTELRELNEGTAEQFGVTLDELNAIRLELHAQRTSLDEATAGAAQVAGTVRKMGERLKQRGLL